MTLPGMTPVPLIEVVTPTGGTMQVMGDEEARRYREAVTGYTERVHYTERSDLEDLDALIALELSVYRWNRWLLSGKDYDGVLLGDENSLRLRVQGYSAQIKDVKKRLKLDRESRAGDLGATVHERWQTLSGRAKELGIVRNVQAARAIEIMLGLFSIVATYDRSNEEERKRLGFADEKAIVDYIRDSRPDFDAVDFAFRQTSQKYWVRAPHLPRSA